MGREGKLRRIGSKSLLSTNFSVESSGAEDAEAGDGDDLSIFAPTTSAGGKQGRGSQGFLLEMLSDETLKDAQTLEHEYDALAGSSKETGAEKARHRSGAEKRERKRNTATAASHSGEDSADSGEDEQMAEAVKEKKCDLCGMKNTEQDPVALSLAAKSGPNKKRSALLRWER
jgi:hypothetical protein